MPSGAPRDDDIAERASDEIDSRITARLGRTYWAGCARDDPPCDAEALSQRLHWGNKAMPGVGTRQS